MDGGGFLRRLLVSVPVIALLAVPFAGPARGEGHPLDALGRAFRHAAGTAAPAVVQVVADRVPGGDLMGPGELPVASGFPYPTEFLEKFQESRRLFVRPEGPASGVVVAPDGYVLTSLYNIAGRVRGVRVVTADGKTYDAEILGRDPNKDVVLLKIEAEDLPYLALSPDAEAVPGQFAVTVGRGQDPARLNVNAGIISAVIRSRGDAIQTSARVNYGNSGGALVDLEGKLLGVLAKIGHDTERNRSGINTGVGFAAPASTLADLFKRLKKGENIPPRPTPFLGIRFDPSYPATADQKGVKIEYVYKGYPGARAGLKTGDVLLSFDHVPIEKRNDLIFVIRQCDPGQRVTFTVQRGDTDLDLEAELTARPGPVENARMSLEYFKWKAPRTLGLRIDHGYAGPGVLVSHVHEGFPLHEGGLRGGDLITSVYGLKNYPLWFPVFRKDLIDRVLQYCITGTEMTFRVRRGDRSRLITVIIGRPAGEERLAAMDREYEATEGNRPAPPTEASRETLAEDLVRWNLLIRLGIRLGEKTEDGFAIDFVHGGFPGERIGMERGNVLTRLNGVDASSLPEHLDILIGPRPNRIWVPGNPWQVGFSAGGREKSGRIALGSDPLPSTLRAMRAEVEDGVRFSLRDLQRLEALLGRPRAAGRLQALQVLDHPDRWKASTAKTVVSLLDEGDRDFVQRLHEALRAHPDRETLGLVIRSLPVQETAVEADRWQDREKRATIEAYLQKTDLPGALPDFGINGKLWQRWWRENRDRIRFP